MKQNNILSLIAYTTLLANPATACAAVSCKVYIVVGTNVYVMYSMCTPNCIHVHVSEHVGTDEWLCLCLSAVPDPPVSLSVVNFGTRALKATWLPPSEVFDDVAKVRYRITASADNVPSQTMETPASSQEQEISGLEPGTMYTVQVCCGDKTLPPPCVHVCAYVRACMCCVFAGVFACVLTRVFAYVHTSVFACICVSVLVHTYMYACVRMHKPHHLEVRRSSETNLVIEIVVNSKILGKNSAREWGGSPGC